MEQAPGRSRPRTGNATSDSCATLRPSSKALEGWHTVKSREEWLKLVETSRDDYHAGRFLIERLGAERLLDPALIATLLGLRQGLLGGLDRPTAADRMLVDCALLAYYNMLRVQGWIGNLALHIEHELFGQGTPTAKLGSESGSAANIPIEERLKRVGEQLLPLLDRANRMLIRNLMAVRELRRGPTPTVAINRAEQVNVAEQQANAVVR